MTQDLPADVDAYFENQLVHEDELLLGALMLSEAAELEPIAVSPSQGAFLQILAKAMGAKRILEIGTLGGYSTIWMARALPPDGELVSLEIDPICVAVAQENIARAKLEKVVSIMHGSARETLDTLIAEGAGPFDFVFIDADKPNNPIYLERCLQLAKPGTLIICDNVVREGAVSDAESRDPNVKGVRTFLEMVGNHPKLTATAIQTVGAKGYDGFAIAIVN